jgi:hypothetical protein
MNLSNKKASNNKNLLLDNKSLLSKVNRIAKSIVIPNNLHFNVISGLIYSEIMKVRFSFPNNQPAFRNNTADRYYYRFILNNKTIEVLLYNKDNSNIYKLILSCNNNAKLIKFTYCNIRRVISNIRETVNQII